MFLAELLYDSVGANFVLVFTECRSRPTLLVGVGHLLVMPVRLGLPQAFLGSRYLTCTSTDRH